MSLLLFICRHIYNIGTQNSARNCLAPPLFIYFRCNCTVHTKLYYVYRKQHPKIKKSKVIQKEKRDTSPDILSNR